MWALQSPSRSSRQCSSSGETARAARCLRALRAARRCVPGQAATQEAYARQSFRANVGADARRAPGLLADAEDQIAFGESLLRRREAEDSAPVAASAPEPVAATPREADDLLAYDDYLDGDALDRRLGSQ